MAIIKKKIALIFGITGQDGSYLAEFLLKKNYIIHGVKRRSSSANTERIDHIFDSINFKSKNFFIHYGDVTDSSNTINIINKVKPDEIYNLAAQSHVRVSFDVPEYTANSTALGSLRILEAIKNLNLKKTKYYQASSSEMFGMQKKGISQNEKTPFHPMSIYGVSKVFAYHTSIFYREAYGIYASNGILFNHESPRRGPTFVTKKIVQALVRIKMKKQNSLSLGNLYAIRDWGHAKDYVETMWKILQYKKPDDWVIATNEEMTVKDFINKCAKKLKMNLIWKNKGIKEVAIDKNTNKTIIKIDKKFFRPGEVDFLKGDYSKAKNLLNWKPRYKSDDLIDDMIKYEQDLYE
jgi:GDPmannose 4,6-dehydratase